MTVKTINKNQSSSHLFYTGEITKYHDYYSKYDGLIAHFKGTREERTDTEPNTIKGHSIDIGSTYFEVNTGKTYIWIGDRWMLLSNGEPTFKSSNEPFPANPEKNDLVFEMDTAKLYYWAGDEWLEVGWNSEPQPTSPQILSAHATFTDGTTVLEEQDITFEDTTVTITATQPGVTKCVLSQFNTSPEGVKVYHNGEVVEEVEFEDNIKLTADEETEYEINLYNPILISLSASYYHAGKMVHGGIITINDKAETTINLRPAQCDEVEIYDFFTKPENTPVKHNGEVITSLKFFPECEISLADKKYKINAVLPEKPLIKRMIFGTKNAQGTSLGDEIVDFPKEGNRDHMIFRREPGSYITIKADNITLWPWEGIWNSFVYRTDNEGSFRFLPSGALSNPISVRNQLFIWPVSNLNNIQDFYEYEWFGYTVSFIN